MTLNKANLRDLIAATGLVISNWIQIVNFSAHVTVKFDRWPGKTIGHLFYATSSFVHHFVAISELKLELQSGNAQSGDSEPCDFEIWRMTLQNNKAPLLCYFKLCASFHSHWWIQTWVTVQKRPIWVKFGAVRPWNLTDDLAKQKGTSSMLLQALCIISYPLVNSNSSYSPETPNLGQIWRFLDPCDVEI